MKIAAIIDQCNMCEHCTVANNSKENKLNFAICMFPGGEPFIISHSETNKILSYELIIPNNCPLEDYTGTQTLEKDED